MHINYYYVFYYATYNTYNILYYSNIIIIYLIFFVVLVTYIITIIFVLLPQYKHHILSSFHSTSDHSSSKPIKHGQIPWTSLARIANTHLHNTNTHTHVSISQKKIVVNCELGSENCVIASQTSKIADMQWMKKEPALCGQAQSCSRLGSHNFGRWCVGKQATTHGC